MLKLCKGKLLPELLLFKKILFDFVQAVITDEILDNYLTQFSLSLFPGSQAVPPHSWQALFWCY